MQGRNTRARGEMADEADTLHRGIELGWETKEDMIFERFAQP